MTVNTLTRAEAESVARALSSLNIKKLSGNGVDLELRKALKQANPDVTVGNSDETKSIEDFFNHIAAVEESFEKLKEQTPASVGKYGKLLACNDCYEYIDIALQVENDRDPAFSPMGGSFNARSAATSEIIDALSKIIPKHSAPGTFMGILKMIDGKAKSDIFRSDASREYYDHYLELKHGGLLEKMELFKKLNPNLLTSVQVAERILPTLQSAMHITRPESVWLYNHLLDLKGTNAFIDMENENAVLMCPNCGAAHRQSSKQFAALYGKKQQIPLCPVCKEPLLKKCPKCGKWLSVCAMQHYCGWNEDVSKHKTALEKALAENDLLGVRKHFDALSQLSAEDSEIALAKKKAQGILDTLDKKIKESRLFISNGDTVSAGKLLDEVEKLCPTYPDLTELRNMIISRQESIRRALLLKNIRDALNKGDLSGAEAGLTTAEKEGMDAASLDVSRREILQRKRIKQINTYTAILEQLIREEKLAEAERVLTEAAGYGIGDELFKYRKLINSRREEIEKNRQQTKEKAIMEFGDGHFGNYVNGLKRIARILDIYPECQQAKGWLKDNPRTFPVSTPELTFAQGEKQCTISWKDDDSFTRYTVCRADGRYPRDPEDGVQVCKEITNQKTTDILPLDQPGVMWQYSIFAIRTLDGQWIKADCPREAVWLPEPTSVKGIVESDGKGNPVIKLSWARLPHDCIGVQIVRRDSSDDFYFAASRLTAPSKDIDQRQAQLHCRFEDDDVETGTVYRYNLKQVWRKGQTNYMSSGVPVEIVVE